MDLEAALRPSFTSINGRPCPGSSRARRPTWICRNACQELGQAMSLLVRLWRLVFPFGGAAPPNTMSNGGHTLSASPLNSGSCRRTISRQAMNNSWAARSPDLVTQMKSQSLMSLDGSRAVVTSSSQRAFFPT